MSNVVSPKNERELIDKVEHISGYTIGDVAGALNVKVPANLKRNKGWAGTLLEHYLGAKAGSKPQQDFPNLGIELKTVPVDSHGYPLETTFVCVAPLVANSGVVWKSSHVRYKLQKVLWLPIEGQRDINLADRRIGVPILWSPSPAEEKVLKRDWQELMDMIVLGSVEKITARHGQYLQLRPKAANGRQLTEAIDAKGQRILTRPRGFYLKKHFTAAILRNYLAHANCVGGISED